MIGHGFELLSAASPGRLAAGAYPALVVAASIAAAGLAALFLFTPSWLAMCALLPLAGTVMETWR